MPAYTTPLWRAIEQAGDTGLNKYPIFDESYRSYLNQRILEHYDEQEIGFETPHRFVFALQRKMFEIMPKYNQLYLSQKLSIDPLNTVNMRTVFDSNADSTNTQLVNANGTMDSTNHDATDVDNNGGSTNSNTSHDVNATTTDTTNRARTTNSAMPQGRLGGDKDYATSGSDVVSGVGTTVDSTSDSTGSGEETHHDKTGTVSNGSVNSNSSNTTDGTGTSVDNLHTENVEIGWNGSQAELLLKYRETFMNIDEMVINELGGLFMLLWNTSDDYENNYDRGMFGYGY